MIAAGHQEPESCGDAESKTVLARAGVRARSPFAPPCVVLLSGRRCSDRSHLVRSSPIFEIKLHYTLSITGVPGKS